MASTKLTETPETRTVVIRGVTYTFKELTAKQYNGIVKLATGPDDQADLNTVLSLMATQSITDPKLTTAELEEKTYPVYAKLLQTVNAMHFSPMEDEAATSEDGTPNG